MEKVENFYTEYEDMFEEYIEDIKRYLRNNNEEYIKLQKEFHETLDKNENLVFVLEGEITNLVFVLEGEITNLNGTLVPNPIKKKWS